MRTTYSYAEESKAVIDSWYTVRYSSFNGLFKSEQPGSSRAHQQVTG